MNKEEYKKSTSPSLSRRTGQCVGVGMAFPRYGESEEIYKIVGDM